MTDDTPHEVTMFVTDLQRQEVAPLTLTSYQSDLALFVRWFVATIGEAFSAAAVTPTDVRDDRAHLVSVEHRAPATVNRRLAALRKFFTWAKAERRITELPTDSVKLVQASPRAPHALEKREVDALMRKAEQRGKKRDIAILALLRHAGIRVSELCALRLGDLDVGERHGRLVVRSGKGSKYREVPVNADARRAIAQYLAVRPRVADDHLFLSQKGSGGMGTKAVQELVARYGRQAGLDDVTPHTLRHSFGKHTLDAGASLVAVAALLGHENLNTTAIYTQPSARDLERAVERLEWGHLDHASQPGHHSNEAQRRRR
jgi:integrase/recombinase XerD